jgi:phage terminase large subunit-like protein
LDDLEHGPARGLHWDLENAQRALDFFPECLRLAEGAFAGQPFVMQPWQQFIVGSLFGWIGADGFRRYRMGYIEVAKGSGKTPLCAGIGLYMLTADGEEGAEVFAAAVSREQAHILFRDATRMVASSPELASRILASGINPVYNLAHLKSGSFFRPVSAEGKSLDGKRPHCVLVDELHEHDSPIVLEKLSAGFKGRRQPLMAMITNSGFDRTSVCYAYHEYAGRAIRGET